MELDTTRIAHLIWTGIITILGGVLHWNWTKLNDEVQSKANKEDTQRELDVLAAERHKDRDAQATMHAENRARLDEIYKLLVEQGPGQKYRR